VKLSPVLSDLFVTLFSTGDFLSPHNDYMSGSWAFVVSLMEAPQDGAEWRDEFGGVLRFRCPHAKGTRPSRYSKRFCEQVRPAFNTALIWRTIPTGPEHQVPHVSWKAEGEGFRRFGFTGWYMDQDSAMLRDKNFVEERNKMRARPGD
jgi:Rps23 Pro-64 3,4-dihydroxylase Tpa1-like proline 4-hydroxylase